MELTTQQRPKSVPKNVEEVRVPIRYDITGQCKVFPNMLNNKTIICEAKLISYHGMKRAILEKLHITTLRALFF
jgi:hypothetical protein